MSIKLAWIWTIPTFGWLLLTAFIFVQPARAFNHPGVPLTLDELNYVKAHLNQQPWEAGFKALEASPYASLNYVEGGPFATVSRYSNQGENQNLPQWEADMTAVYQLALMYYFTGNTAYASKATAIWDGWVTTMTTLGGNQGYLAVGDILPYLFGGPDILRGTYPGWTSQDTTDSTNYYNNVIKPALGGTPPEPVLGANQGTALITAAICLAVCVDDTNYWNEALYAYRNDAGGLPDAAPMGMVGDGGRDPGHWQDQMSHLFLGAAVAWSQGVDLFSEDNNRLAKVAEYYSQWAQCNVVPWVTFGSVYGQYPAFSPSTSLGSDLSYRAIIQTAYETRQGITLPWTDLMTTEWGDATNFELLRLSDTSTATYSPLAPLATPAPATAGEWTDADIGSAGLSGSSSYGNGVWTVSGGGADFNPNDNGDQFHFAYKALSGDFIFVARVLSQTPAGVYAKAGLMIRDSLSSTANFAEIHMMPTLVEAMVRGATWESHGDTIINFPQTMAYWLKVERRGQWIDRFCSPDGINWQPIDYAEMSTISEGSTVYVGLEACANNNSDLMTATFDNVAISPISGSGVAPATPTNLVAARGQGQAMLSWIPGAGATLCNVKRATSSGGPYTEIAANVPAATYTDMDLTNGTTYYYVVSGTNAVGESVNSTQASVKPSATAAVPAAPTGLTAFASDGSAVLNWSAVSGASSYDVKRATVSGGPYTRVFYGQGVVITSFADLTATDGTTYYYVVDAVNSYGESAPSNQATATPQTALVWTGATSGTWDATTTGNWTTSGTSVVYSNGNPVQFDDTAYTTNIYTTGTMTPNSALINNSTTNYTFNTTAIGGTAHVVKRGSGQLSLVAAQAFSGGMDIDDACTVNFYQGATLGAGVVNINANVGFWATSNHGYWVGELPSGFNIAGGDTLNYYGDWFASFNGNFTGTGTLDITPGVHSTGMIFSGSNGGFAGTVDIDSGGPPLLLNSVDAGSANAVWNLMGTGNQLGTNVSGGTFYLGEVSGTSGTIFNNVTTANTATLVIGDNNLDDSPVFAGSIVNNGSGKLSITKVGANTQTLSGTTTYTGPTTITGGTLIIKSTLASAVTVTTTGTLGGTGTLSGAVNVSGAVSPGSYGAGTLNVAGVFTLNGGSAVKLQLGNPSDQIALTGSYTGPTSGVVAVNTSAVAGFGMGTYPLITGASGITTGNFVLGPTPSGFTCSLNAANGTLSLVVVGPPVPPAGVTIFIGNQTATLNWTASVGATSYTVQRSTVSGSGYVTVATDLTSTTFTDTGLTDGATYYYVITAEGSLGQSPTSTEVSATPANLNIYLKFDETSGTTAHDSTGDGWNAICWNSPSWVPGLINNALSLNGTNNYVSLPSGIVKPLTNLTISAWVNLNALVNWQRIFDFGTGTTVYMFLSPQSGSGNLRFAITTSGGGGEQQINASGPLTTGTWTHVAVTLSGSTGTLYVNGTVVATNTAMTLSPYSLGNTTLNYFGRSQFSADPYLNGTVDDFRIYGAALSAAEIAQLAWPPAAPIGVSGNGGISEVMLSWSAAIPATGYNIYRGTSSGGPYSDVASGIIGTSYVDTSGTNGTTYYYVVTTLNDVAESAWSSEVSAMPVAPISGPETLAPALVMSGTGANTNLAFTVRSSVAGHTYQLQYSKNLASNSWTNVGSPQSGTGADLILNLTINSSSVTSGFYRVLIQQ